MKSAMRVFGIVGWSGSGKTTLIEKLIPELTGRGVRVSTMKHTHHGFQMDKPGKDTYRHREAGATEVAVLSNTGWALQHELRGAEEPSVEEMIARMTPVDLLLIEGFKNHSHPKLEVFRPSAREKGRQPDDVTIVAVATDEALDAATVPVLDLNDIAAVADFILDQCGLGADDGAA